MGQAPRWGARRRAWRWLVLSCVVVALVWWWHEREPRYNGRSLSSWLDTYDAILSGHLTDPGFEETRTALRHLGNKGLSYYTRRLAYETPGWHLSILSVLHKTPKPLQRTSETLAGCLREHIDARVRRAKTAVLAFELLGADAARAIPDLERLAFSTAYPARSQRALNALARLGPDGTMALARVVVKADTGPSAEALRLLMEMGTRAGPAMPLITQALGTNFSADPDQFYRDQIGKLQVTAQYSNSLARVHAMRSLAVYSPDALRRLLWDTNPAVRADVTNALRGTRVGERYLATTNYGGTLIGSSTGSRRELIAR